MKSKPKIRKVEAWTIIVYDGMLSAFISQPLGKPMIRGKAIFTDLAEARNELATFKEEDGYAQNARLVPCTITYQLPPLPTKKKKR